MDCQVGKFLLTSFLVVSTEFAYHATKRKHKTRGTLTSATGFKKKLRIQKSDINTGKIRCGVANQLLNVCIFAIGKMEYLQIQLIEQVVAKDGEDIDKILWEREKYWQA